MKNNKFILSLATLSLIAPMMFTSCAKEEVDVNPIDVILAKLEKGFTLNGTVTQQRKISNIALNGTVTPQGTPESQDYRVEALYENSNERIGTAITHYGQLGETETIIDQLNAYVDDDGYCYQEFLNYKNEVEVKNLGEYGNNLVFASAGLYNFASILTSKDFTYNEEKGLYYIDTNKMGLVFANMLGRVNSGFYYTPISVTVGIENDMFDTLEVVIENFSKITFEEDHYVQVQYLNSAKFTFDKVGETKLTRVTPVASKAENSELKSALTKIGDNFTYTITSNIAQDEGDKHKTFRLEKFTGDKILVQDFDHKILAGKLSPENHFILQKLQDSQMDQLYCYVMVDKENKTYEKSATQKFAKNYQGVYYYEDLLPTPGAISSDFFTYDRDFNEYVCNDAEIVQLIAPLMNISRAPLQNDHILNAQKIGIRLTDNGDIAYFKFYVNYQDLFNGTTYNGDVLIEVKDIGGTEI